MSCELNQWEVTTALNHIYGCVVEREIKTTYCSHTSIGYQVTGVTTEGQGMSENK